MNVHEAAVKIVGHYDRESHTPRQHHTADLKRAESVIAQAIADATAEQTRQLKAIQAAWSRVAGSPSVNRVGQRNATESPLTIGH